MHISSDLNQTSPELTLSQQREQQVGAADLSSIQVQLNSALEKNNSFHNFPSEIAEYLKEALIKECFIKHGENPDIRGISSGLSPTNKESYISAEIGDFQHATIRPDTLVAEYLKTNPDFKMPELQLPAEPSSVELAQIQLQKDKDELLNALSQANNLRSEQIIERDKEIAEIKSGWLGWARSAPDQIPYVGEKPLTEDEILRFVTPELKNSENFPVLFEAMMTRLESQKEGPIDINLLDSVGQSLKDSTVSFATGFGNSIYSMVTEPFLQVHDLTFVGVSVIYNEALKSEDSASWLPQMYSGTAKSYEQGASQVRIMLQNMPIVNVGVFSYDATTVVREGRWGDVNEQLGGMAAGFITGKAIGHYKNVPIGISGGKQMNHLDIRPLKPPARELGRNEGILIDHSHGLQSRTSGRFKDIEIGSHPENHTKYLYTIDERGINIALERTPFDTDRKNIVHTNLSSEASIGGEAWFTGNKSVTVNAGSGRFGDASGITLLQWEKTVQYWESLGYDVNAIPFGKR